jgi:hypothetical protein
MAANDPSLVGWWKLDDGSGTTAADSSGAGNNGTIQGGGTWTTGKIGGGLQLNGTNAYMTANFIPLDNRSFTIAMWFNPTAMSGNHDLFTEGTGSNNNLVHIRLGGPSPLYGTPVNGIRFSFYDTTATQDCDTPTNLFQTNTWYHVVCVFDIVAMTKTIYINGVQQAQKLSNSAFTGTTGNPQFGAGTSMGGEYFNGILDDARIYTKALTIGEVQRVMTGSTAPTASNPKPSDKATDVVRDVVLSWTPGPSAGKHNVYLGTSFNDVNIATASSPLLVSAGQDANNYDPLGPGLLSFGTTYYWRVDEVNATADHTVFKGDVWSFAAEPVAYPVTGVTATASSTAAGYSAQFTVDGSGLTGDLATTDSATTEWVSTVNPTSPVWIEYDLGALYKLSEMWVWNSNYQFEWALNFGIKSVTIQYSANGTDWTKLGDYQFAQAPSAAGYAHNTTVSFNGVAARKVRITANSNYGGKQYGLSEVRFFYIPTVAREPSPATGSTSLNPNGIVLNWRAGRDAVSHTVQFGTDSNAVTNGTAVLASTNQNSYSLASLDLGKTYYWRVDEVNQAAVPSVWTGDVWSFTTTSYITIDDMESYNDTTNQIFNVWVDGYGTTTNGSVVGLTTSVNGTFGSTTIFHGGKQSMPFAYNNTAPIAISEATRTWASPVNWTTNGATALRLWVQGRPVGMLQTSSNSFDMSSAGSDIYQGTDQFRFVYKQLTGDGSITARVDYQQPTSQYAKAGVMIRVGTQVGAQQAYMATLPGTPNTTTTPTQVEWGFRNPAGDTTARSLAVTPTPMAPWVRITRAGDVITGAYSVDGVTWVSTNITTTPQTIAMGSPVNIGLIVCSHVADQLGEAKFSNVQATGNVTGNWTTADIGITAQPASNTPDAFYVALTDSAGHSKTVVPTATNPVCTTATWQAVDIPLSQFTGVTLSSVKSMTIGVGDKTNPQHGVGQLFIDDIGFGH